MSRAWGCGLLFALYCWSVGLAGAEKGPASLINALGMLAWVLMVALWWERIACWLLCPVGEHKKEKTDAAA